MNFDEMNLQDFELNALSVMGFEAATDIQSKTIPLILEGKDVIGKSKTGSGKTFAYGLPIIDKLETFNKKTQALIVAPTRELAEQIFKELKKLTKGKLSYEIVPVYGGVNMQRQLQDIRKGAKIIVGTPGRIMDHLRRKTIDLRHLKTLVLDEADEMLNMGFKEDIETILGSCNEDHQTVMFSATMPPAILAITKNFMKEPVLVEIDEAEDKVDVKELYVSVGLRDKPKALLEVLAKYQPKISIVFTNTKRMAEQVAESLKEYGYKALSLHGDMRQNARKSVMNRFKALKKADSRPTDSFSEVELLQGTNILVATDVAARGIDINNVDIVINYDIPNDENYYTHRIGRTGRGSNSGFAVSIANTREQVKLLKQLGQKRKTEMTELQIESSKAYQVSDLSGELSFPKREQKKNGNRNGGRTRSSLDRVPSGAVRSDRKPYGERKTDGEHRSYGDRKPYGERKTDGEHRSYGDRKPYGERKTDGEHRSYGDRKPYGERKTDGEHRSYGDRKPYGEKKADGERKSYGDRKPYGERKTDGEHRSYGDRKPYGERKTDGEHKGYAKSGFNKNKSSYSQKPSYSRAKKNVSDN